MSTTGHPVSSSVLGSFESRAPSQDAVWLHNLAAAARKLQTGSEWVLGILAGIDRDVDEAKRAELHAYA